MKTEKKKKYKMVSVNLTNNCKKKPRCSFCYLKRETALSALLEKKKSDRLNNWDVLMKLRDLETEQIAFSYNGLELYRLVETIKYLAMPGTLVHITTRAEFLKRQHLALFKNLGVTMVALSLDTEVKDLEGFDVMVKMIKEKGLKLGLNILMLDEMFPLVSKLLDKYSKGVDQIHLLRPKFYQPKISLKDRRSFIFLLKQKYKNLFIDECFRNEFQGLRCRRGKDFISINADNSVSLCSFDITRDNEKDVEKCPYI